MKKISQRLKEVSEKNKENLTKIEEIENKTKKNLEANEANLKEIKDVKGDIMKEAVAITSIILTVMTFFLANSGILTAIRDSGVVGRRNIFEILIQVNASMVIGVSTLMMIASAFIHKGRFRNKEGRGNKESGGTFLESSQFIVPVIIIIVALIILIISVLVF